MIQEILTSHPDAVVIVPFGALFVWLAKILYDTSVQLKETRTILFGVDSNNPGDLHRYNIRITEAHRRLDRHGSIINAIVQQTKVEIPEDLNQ